MEHLVYPEYRHRAGSCPANALTRSPGAQFTERATEHRRAKDTPRSHVMLMTAYLREGLGLSNLYLSSMTSLLFFKGTKASSPSRPHTHVHAHTYTRTHMYTRTLMHTRTHVHTHTSDLD